MDNLLEYKGLLNDELFDKLLEGKRFIVNRIVSPSMPEGDVKWYDQEEDEWLVLLQGEASIEYSDGKKKMLKPFDILNIPAHCRHRVAYTSSEPLAVWLTIHYEK